jgi:hypothetical protein
VNGCIYHSELQVITALSLTSALYKSLAQAKFSQSSLDVSWQRFLTVEILQLRALRSPSHSRSCRNQINLLPLSPLCNPSARTTSKTQFYYCVRFRGNMFTEPLLRNGRLFIRLLLYTLFVSRPLSSNGSTSHNIIICNAMTCCPV